MSVSFCHLVRVSKYLSNELADYVSTYCPFPLLFHQDLMTFSLKDGELIF